MPFPPLRWLVRGSMPLAVLLALAVAPAAPAAPIDPAGVLPGQQYHRIFASDLTTFIGVSGIFPPIFPLMGSLQDADFYVTQASNTAGLISGWNGTDTIYTAILSTSTVNAKDRFTLSGPIYNTNDELIANDAADLWDGTLANPIAYNEFGIEITHSFEVWTGTVLSGNWDGNSCGNWDSSTSSAAYGLASQSDDTWVFNGTQQCNGSARLYGISPAITAVPEPSAWVLSLLGIAGVVLFWRFRPATQS